MSYKKITIPITVSSPPVDGDCTYYYFVEYKLSGDTAYSSFQTTDNPIVIQPVVSGSTYNVRITRYCCNGAVSSATTLDVNT